MPKKEKNDYVLEIRSSESDKLLRDKEYTKAYSELQAERNFRIRAEDEGWDYFWGRDYVRILIYEIAPIPKPPPQKKSKEPLRESPEWGFCPKCRNELDDDYCQNCGWRRYSQWYTRIKRESAILKGESHLIKE